MFNGILKPFSFIIFQEHEQMIAWIWCLSSTVGPAGLWHWTHQNSVRVHWICLISLEKVNAHLLTSNQWSASVIVPSLQGGEFNVADNNCLHKGHCTTKDLNQWIIYNTFGNRVQNPGDTIKLTFIADVSKQLSRGRGRGLTADIKFYGFCIAYHTYYSYHSWQGPPSTNGTMT